MFLNKLSDSLLSLLNNVKAAHFASTNYPAHKYLDKLYNRVASDYDRVCELALAHSEAVTHPSDVQHEIITSTIEGLRAHLKLILVQIAAIQPEYTDKGIENCIGDIYERYSKEYNYILPMFIGDYHAISA